MLAWPTEPHPNIKEEILCLDGTQVDDLSPLSQLSDLRSLSLNRTNVSDLTPLEDLANLRILELKDTRVTHDDIAELQEALPDCTIAQ